MSPPIFWRGINLNYVVQYRAVDPFSQKYREGYGTVLTLTDGTMKYLQVPFRKAEIEIETALQDVAKLWNTPPRPT